MCVCVCVSVGEGGVIKGWEERTLNMSKAVRYNKEQGTFTVEKAGVYFLFCQVSSCSGLNFIQLHCMDSKIAPTLFSLPRWTPKSKFCSILISKAEIITIFTFKMDGIEFINNHQSSKCVCFQNLTWEFMKVCVFMLFQWRGRCRDTFFFVVLNMRTYSSQAKIGTKM